jgi:hypothetical protein
MLGFVGQVLAFDAWHQISFVIPTCQMSYGESYPWEPFGEALFLGNRAGRPQGTVRRQTGTEREHLEMLSRG